MNTSALLSPRDLQRATMRVRDAVPVAALADFRLLEGHLDAVDSELVAVRAQGELTRVLGAILEQRRSIQPLAVRGVEALEAEANAFAAHAALEQRRVELAEAESGRAHEIRLAELSMRGAGLRELVALAGNKTFVGALVACAPVVVAVWEGVQLLLQGTSP